MKESEFIELLNLYLDHEISAADAARLEAEVQSNAERRRVYREYCQMQKACTVLAKDFADQPADRKVISFEPRRASRSPVWFAAGGLAVAAACVALVVVNRAPQTATVAPAAPQALASTATPSVAAPVVEKSPATAAPAASVAIEPATQVASSTPAAANGANAHLVLASAPVPLASANPIDVAALLANTQQNAQAQQILQAQLDWMHSVQLAPIQQAPMSDPRLDARSPLQTYTKPRQTQGNVEMTAFKFQR